MKCNGLLAPSVVKLCPERRTAVALVTPNAPASDEDHFRHQPMLAIDDHV